MMALTKVPIRQVGFAAATVALLVAIVTTVGTAGAQTPTLGMLDMQRLSELCQLLSGLATGMMSGLCVGS